jgi:hypothetical protein
MKLNELIKDFTIFTSNQEQKLLEQLDSPKYLNSFDEKDRVTIENLVRKSLVSKVRHNGSIMVIRNEN